MAVWFTSDTHFGHERAIELALRPFASTDHMNEEIIKRWNERVTKGDVVYHLGDFAFCDHDQFLSRLNGQKRLIIGNHDHSNRVKKAAGWATVNDILTIKVEETSIVLCHYALRVWNRSHYGALHLYGHSHGNLEGDTQSCDVGVDCWDYRPVSLDEIRVKLASSKPRIPVDHHK